MKNKLDVYAAIPMEDDVKHSEDLFIDNEYNFKKNTPLEVLDLHGGTSKTMWHLIMSPFI